MHRAAVTAEPDTEAAKLEWTLPISASEEADPTETRARYGFDGRLLSEMESKTIPAHHGLHHHGLQPSQAGYTMPEILLLVRSTAIPQRSLALSILARIVSRARSETKITSDDWARGLLYLRLATDEKSMTIRSNALVALSEILASNQSELEVYKHAEPLLSSTALTMCEEDLHELHQKPLESLICRTRLLESLRLTSESSPSNDAILDILLAATRISRPMTNYVYQEPGIIKAVYQVMAACQWPAESVNPKILLLLQRCAACKRSIAVQMEKDGVIDRVWRFLSLTSEPFALSPNTLKVMEGALNFLADIGRYGLGGRKLMQHWSTLQNLTSVVTSSQSQLLGPMFRLLQVFTVQAAEPHDISPEHGIVWNQIELWSDFGRTNLPHSLHYLAAFVSGLKHINHKEKDSLSRSVWSSVSHTYSYQQLITSLLQSSDQSSSLFLSQSRDVWSLRQIQVKGDIAREAQAEEFLVTSARKLLTLILDSPEYRNEAIVRFIYSCGIITQSMLATMPQGCEDLAWDLLQAIVPADDKDALLPFYTEQLRPANHVLSASQDPIISTLGSIGSLLRTPKQGRAGLPLAEDWICSSVTEEIINSSNSRVLKSLPPAWSYSETTLMKKALSLASSQWTDSTPTPALRIFALSRVLALELDVAVPGQDEVFRDTSVAECLSKLMGLRATLTRAADFDTITKPYLKTVSCYQFFTDLCGLLSGTFPHPSFLLLLSFASMQSPYDYRLLLWNDYPMLMRTMSPKPSDLAMLTINGHRDWLFPLESRIEVLTAYAKAICSRKVQPSNGFTYQIALHHLAAYVWNQNPPAFLRNLFNNSPDDGTISDLLRCDLDHDKDLVRDGNRCLVSKETLLQRLAICRQHLPHQACEALQQRMILE